MGRREDASSELSLLHDSVEVSGIDDRLHYPRSLLLLLISVATATSTSDCILPPYQSLTEAVFTLLPTHIVAKKNTQRKEKRESEREGEEGTERQTDS